MVVEFGELPRVRHPGARKPGAWMGHAEDAAALKKRPNVWARLVIAGTRDQAARPAGLIKNGQAHGFEPDYGGHFEAATRRHFEGDTETDRYDLWVIYVPTGPKDTGITPPAPKRVSPKRA